MSFFYEDQAYPGNDPYRIAQQMGIPPWQVEQLLAGESGGMPPGMGGGGGFGQMGGGGQYPDYDPNMMAEMVGQQYNPYQGYPTKQVSDQVWDVMGPMDEYLLPQMHKLLNPDAESFDLDTFFQAQPSLRGPLAEAYTEADGDTIKLYNYLQSNEPMESVNAQGEDVVTPGFRDRFAKEVGREEWEALARQGYQPIIQAANKGASAEEIDKIAIDALMGQLEGTIAGGAPTSQRAMSQLDYTRQREGFRPAPGTGENPYAAGGGGDGSLSTPIGFEDGSVDLGNGMVIDAETGQVRPAIGGGMMGGGGQPGIGGGSDPLADLARSPQYGGGGGGDREMVPGPNFGMPQWQGSLGMLINTRRQPMPDYFSGRGRPNNARPQRRRRDDDDDNRRGGGGSGGMWGRFVRSLRPGPG